MLTEHQAYNQQLPEVCKEFGNCASNNVEGTELTSLSQLHISSTQDGGSILWGKSAIYWTPAILWAAHPNTAHSA